MKKYYQQKKKRIKNQKKVNYLHMTELKEKNLLHIMVYNKWILMKMVQLYYMKYIIKI